MFADHTTSIRKLATLATILCVSGATLAGPSFAANAPTDPITDVDVLAAEAAWGAAIVDIGDVFTKGGDYKAAALKHIDALYGYGDGTVLFKPTKASADEFRETKDEALSYFVTGVVPEDHGFALQPWTNVRFDNDGIVIDKDSALAMGNYYFTDAKTGKEVKVDFTFGFKRAPDDGHLEIFVHHSSFPFQPAK